MIRRVHLLCLPLMIAGTAYGQEESFDLSDAASSKPPPQLYTSSIEAGIGYQSSNTFHIGRYGGVVGQAPFAIVKGTSDGSDAWNQGRKFWDASIGVYGFDTLNINLRAGIQGLWRASAFYDGFTRTFADSARTPYFGAGTGSLVLPANWVSGSSSSQFSVLNATAKPLDLKVAWRNAGGAFVLTPFSGYEFKIQFDYRRRQGTRPQSLAFGHEGNFPVGVFFPQPVDYNSYQATASFGFANARLQWNASYNFALFANGFDAVTLPNPFSRSLNNLPGNAWPAGPFAGHPFSTAQYALPPDSAAHRFGFAGAYSVSPKTRLTLRASYQIQTQNDAFLPYTISPRIFVGTPPPRSSFNGKVRNTHIAAGLTSREWKRADFSASYSYDDRHNLSPMDTYSYVANDTQDQLQPFIPGNSRYIRLNLPYSFTFHQVKAEAGYRIAPRTRLSLAYTGDFKWRNYQQVSQTDEHTVRAKALSTFSDGSVWVAGSYATRDVGAYDVALPWVLSHTDSYLNVSNTRDGIENPLLRKYNMADRRRTEAKAGLTADVTQRLVVDVSGGMARDNYLDSPIGLRSSDSYRADADLTYIVSKALTASLFAGAERIRANLNGYLIFDSVAGNANRQWNVRSFDTMHNLGARVSWLVLPEKFKLDGSYILADGTSRTMVQSFQGFIGTVSSPLPAVRDINHSANLAGEYSFRPDAALRLGYTVVRQVTRDWQYANMGLAPVAQILGSGIQPPRYTAHIVWVTTRYQF